MIITTAYNLFVYMFSIVCEVVGSGVGLLGDDVCTMVVESVQYC